MGNPESATDKQIPVSETITSKIDWKNWKTDRKAIMPGELKQAASFCQILTYKKFPGKNQPTRVTNNNPFAVGDVHSVSCLLSSPMLKVEAPSISHENSPGRNANHLARRKVL